MYCSKADSYFIGTHLLNDLLVVRAKNNLACIVQRIVRDDKFLFFFLFFDHTMISSVSRFIRRITILNNFP